MQRLKTFEITRWDNREPFLNFAPHLEDGQVLFFPKLDFKLSLDEQKLLRPEYVNPKAKNISFNTHTQEVKGLVKNISVQSRMDLKDLLKRYSYYTREFIYHYLPTYKKELILGRTSLRPVEISGRTSSYRQDDKRLHVDSFPANPNHGFRILRVFTNINPSGKPRIWRLGEPFEKVVQTFLSRTKKPFIGSRKFFEIVGITKKFRSLYDHYMLQIHDHMKRDIQYQKKADQETIAFPANSTWIVQTDHVSHAAMSGQHLLEQTFYLPVSAMKDEGKSPLRILETILKKNLVNN